MDDDHWQLTWEGCALIITNIATTIITTTATNSHNYNDDNCNYNEEKVNKITVYYLIINKTRQENRSAVSSLKAVVNWIISLPSISVTEFSLLLF